MTGPDHAESDRSTEQGGRYDRLASTETGAGELIVYDVENPSAWIMTDRSFDQVDVV